MNKGKRRVLQVLALIVIAGAAMAAWRFAGDRADSRDDEILRPVRTSLPERRDLEETVEAWGNLRSANQVTVLPKVTGTVKAVHREVGDAVEVGDVLAEIDPEPYRLDFDRAEAARIAAASTWERLDRLYSAGNATRQDWENARAAHLAAQAQASAAGLMLDWTRIVSPASGVVLIRHTNAGSLASPEAPTPLYTVGSLDDLELELHLPESRYPTFAGPLPPGVDIRADSFPGLDITAEIRSVAPWVDPSNRTFAVVCRVDTPEGILRPGMLMRARFTTDVKRGILTVPVSALTGGDGVWTVDSHGTAHFEELHSPMISGGNLVLPDTWEGRRVITEGQHFLKDGDAVRAVSGEESGS